MGEIILAGGGEPGLPKGTDQKFCLANRGPLKSFFCLYYISCLQREGQEKFFGPGAHPAGKISGTMKWAANDNNLFEHMLSKKFEIRSTQFETNPKAQNSNVPKKVQNDFL